MKPKTLAAAVAAGASVILRGHGRAYAPGDTAYRVVSLPERGLDPADVGGFLMPVVWRDGRGWVVASTYNGRPEGLPAAELVTVLDPRP